MPAGETSAVEQAAFRTVLGHFASGVVIVTGTDGGRPVGFTCQSFFSLSLDPPLVAFAPGRASRSWPAIQRAGSCAVNVLTEGQEHLARAFARSGADKFAGVRWSRRASGAPRLDGALAWIECDIDQVVDGGDHHLAVARVTAMETGSGEPLVFYRGGFGTFRA